MYATSPALLDPPVIGVLTNGLSWVEGVLLGPIAIMVATIAVATLGFLMLAGRIDVRRGATVIVGCFLIFGAKGIGNTLTVRTGVHSTPPFPPIMAPLTPEVRLLPSTTAPYDPYAGASVPLQR